jgi:hypothetical protein
MRERVAAAVFVSVRYVYDLVFTVAKPVRDVTVFTTKRCRRQLYSVAGAVRRGGDARSRERRRDRRFASCVSRVANIATGRSL